MTKPKPENRGLDTDIYEVICRRFYSQPHNKTMNMLIDYLGLGISCVKVHPQSVYSTHGGRVHGGQIATLADIAMGLAAFTQDGGVWRTVEINMSYLAPAFEETELKAEGKVIHPGKSMSVVEGSVFNDEGWLIAKSRGIFIKDKKWREPDFY